MSRLPEKKRQGKSASRRKKPLPTHQHTAASSPHQARSKSYAKRFTPKGPQEGAKASSGPSPLLDEAREQSLEKLAFWNRPPEAKTAAVTIQLDPWQEDAVNALLAGANVVVDAPTSAGKTLVVETFLDQHIHDAGFRACYTCPVKSLSNDKLREFREKYGKEAVGIATGDIKENLDAPLVIATLESYRNSLLGVEPDLGRKLVIFDEYHFLQDEGRGSSWEEAIILTPPRCQLLLLSASLSNAADFANWLEQLSDRPSALITVKHRPVPLVDLVWHEGTWFFPDTLPKKIFPRDRNPYVEPLPLREIPSRIVPLEALGLTPAIIYAGKRLSCDLLAQALCAHLAPLGKEQRELIGSRLMQADQEYKALSFIKPSLRKMIQIYGVAYHHSGLAPMARLLIESLVKDGLMRFCVATMGLSLGINFSVKSTIISDAIRPGETGFTPYSSSEVLQMTGRAGRRGKDRVGFSCWLSPDFYKKFTGTQREACNSRLRNDPTTFLGLVSRGFSLGKIEQFYRKSFRSFMASRSSHALLARPSRLMKSLESQELPCQSPVHEFTLFHDQQNSLCYDCNLRKACHKEMQGLNQSPLARLHLHLHRIGALNPQEGLSAFGEFARYFPQNGGLLLANMLEREEIHAGNLQAALQLIGALSLAHYKNPEVPASYRLPFAVATIENDLQVLYPPDLFPEVYDTAKGRRKNLTIKEFNPQAGYVLKIWAEGCSWQELLEQVSNEQFGAGDVTGLLYRAASYLQSLVQTLGGGGGGQLAQAAKELRDHILREPLQITL